jgi:hypothetical protein
MARRRKSSDDHDPAPTDDAPAAAPPLVAAALAGLRTRADAGLAAPRHPAARLYRREGLVVHCTGGRRPETPDDVAAVLRAVQHCHMAPPRWVPALDEQGRPKVKRDGSPRLKNLGGRGWPDAAYHWALDAWGRVWHMRGWGVVGSHAKAGGHNLKSHGIVVLGKGEEMTEAEQGALLWVIGDAERRFGPQFVRAHRDIPGVAKRCPGDAVAAFVRSLGKG